MPDKMAHSLNRRKYDYAYHKCPLSTNQVCNRNYASRMTYYLHLQYKKHIKWEIATCANEVQDTTANKDH